MPNKIVTIAGSDSISGGGIQADLATFAEYGVFGFSAITSIVTIVDDDFRIHEIDLTTLKEQLETIFALPDILAIKIGLLPSVEIIGLVSDILAKNQDKFIVCDPVLVFKETSDVSTAHFAQEMIDNIFPYADILTPNLEEAMIFANMQEIRTLDDVHLAARRIIRKGAKSVVIKGGNRLAGDMAYDFYYDGLVSHTFANKKLDVNSNNGSGCTFSSAIASNLANGLPMIVAIEDAKEFVYEGIKHGIAISEELGNVWQAARRKCN